MLPESKWKVFTSASPPFPANELIIVFPNNSPALKHNSEHPINKNMISLFFIFILSSSTLLMMCNSEQRGESPGKLYLQRTLEDSSP